MKKRYATRLSEIIANDPLAIGDFMENFQVYLFDKVLGMGSGVVFGLAVTNPSVSGVSVSSGSLVDLTLTYGELEGASGVLLTSFPVSGTRTDTVAARYLQLTDSPGTSYILTDVESRTETVSTVFRRQFGSIQITVEQDTAPSGLTGNKMALATLSVTSGGIQSVVDVRGFVKPTNIDTTVVSTAGDVTGSLSATVVTKMQGIPISTTDPTSGQVYVYNGTNLIPVTIGGDISGYPSNLSVNNIKAIPVSGVGTSGQVLSLNSTGDAYIHQTLASTSDVVPVGGVILWKGNSCPAGYTRDDDFADLFPRGAAVAANPGLTGGAATHDHTFSGSDPKVSQISTNGDNSGCSASPGIYNYEAVISGTTGSGSTLPPYRTVLFCRKT